MSSHKIEYVKFIRITYTSPLYSSKGNLISNVTDAKDFKTAHHAARWYAEQWNHKRWSKHNLPLQLAGLPHHAGWDDKTETVKRRVKKIFKQYLP